MSRVRHKKPREGRGEDHIMDDAWKVPPEGGIMYLEGEGDYLCTNEQPTKSTLSLSVSYNPEHLDCAIDLDHEGQNSGSMLRIKIECSPRSPGS